MMDEKVRTLYEFDGDASTGELSFAVNEILVITNKDVDEGWWEGRKSDGTVGLFPQAYVHVESSSSNFSDDSNQQPLQSQNTAQLSSEDPFLQNKQLDPFASDPFQQDTSTSELHDDPFQQVEIAKSFGYEDTIQQTFEQSSSLGNVFDGFPPPPVSTTSSNGLPVEANVSDVNVGDWANAPSSPKSPTEPSPIQPNISSEARSASVQRSSTTKKPKNIFSNFTKTAGATFVLGDTKIDASGEKKSPIVIGPDGPMWENSPHVFSCTIDNPTKETKFKIKNYIAYEVTASHSKKSVLRRYKHFDWLYEQLLRKYGIAISIAPPPDKQITGRYEDDFVEGRRAQLQAWLGRMGLHPVISQSEVLAHFLKYHKNEKDWKAGKRRAEKDEIVGPVFLATIEAPPQHLELHLAELTLDGHVKFTRSMDDACKQLIAVGLEQTKKSYLIRHKENERFGIALSSLSGAFSLDEREVSTPLTQAIKRTGSCFESIGDLYKDQATNDWNPFLTGLYEYKAVLSTFPSILTNQKSALDKNKEVQRLYGENKVSQEEMKNAAARTEKLSYAVQAELNHFQHYRVGDFVGYMQDFLQQQIAFHQNIVQKLKQALLDYENMTE